ncbi:WbqC family protein [Candidatus Thioglobus sp.]|nr:WbqC family protein [Candidatus Thioglobus sp.]
MNTNTDKAIKAVGNSISIEKKVAILQSNYIPWKGYFDLIASVDEFIIFDDMQYTRRDWRNRNRIKTPIGLKWLSVPVQVKGKYDQKIRETQLSGSDWQITHWRILEQNYRNTPYFDEIEEWLKPLYTERFYTSLSEMNLTFISSIISYLSIDTVISNSSDYILASEKTERLVDLCRQVGGTEYISGPAAKAYIDENVFEQMNIKLKWFDYSCYQEYPQLWGEFVHEVTILDLLFNCGKNSKSHMRLSHQ